MLGVECVTGNFFAALGVPSAAGRLLTSHPESPGVAVARDSRHAHHAAWRCGAVTVVGVADQEFSGLAIGTSLPLCRVGVECDWPTGGQRSA